MLTVMSNVALAQQGNQPLVLLDCDPGHDDALAIVAAAHHSELVGITTVAGNAPLASTTHNALVMRDLLGIDVAVHSGASRPLRVEPVSASYIHGESGLDGAELPAPITPLDGVDAARFIADLCTTHPGLHLVATGPLTNIAAALQQAPDIAGLVGGISLMGGGSFGNRTAAAEFNIWADPDAARLVFRSGAPITMAGLDVTHQFQATTDRIERVRSIDGALAAVLADLLDFFSTMYRSRHDAGALDGAAMHDPLALLAVTHPQLFDMKRRHVEIETGAGLTRGATVIDERRLIERQSPNCNVLTTVDTDRAFEVLLAAIEAFSV